MRGCNAASSRVGAVAPGTVSSRACGDRLAVDVDGTVAEQRHQRVEVLAHVAGGAVVRQAVAALDRDPVRQADAQHQP